MIIKKIAETLAAAVMIAMITGMRTQAADYRVYDAYLDQNADGSITAEWERGDDSSPYKLQLYRKTSEAGKLISVGSSVDSYDFSETIYNKGTGTYYYIIYPTKDPLAITKSDSFDADTETMSALRPYYYELQKKKQEEEKKKKQQTDPGQTGPGGGSTPITPYWVKNPNGTWSYIGIDGKRLQSTWADIGGYKYLFDKSSIMLTGWQFISSRWYYLEPAADYSHGLPQGAMWKNATTPDGYYVNSDGMWESNGKVVTTKTTSSSSNNDYYKTQSVSSANFSSQNKQTAKEKDITSCSLRLSVSDVAAGTCKKAEITSASYSSIQSVSCDQEWSSWTAGNEVRFTITLTADSGYKYSSNCRYTVSSGTIYSNTGDSFMRQIVIGYRPVMKLQSPSGFYVSDGILHWSKSNRAKQYKLTITSGSVRYKTVTVTEPQLDLWEYGNPDDDASYTIKMTAIGPEGSSYYIDSDSVTVDAVDLNSPQTLNGSFTYSGTRLRYLDEWGEPAPGWQYLLGSWYHFNAKGWAEEPGWFQDTDGNWYYFDSQHHMVTGSVTDNGKTYYLNDGSHGSYPVGAWVH